MKEKMAMVPDINWSEAVKQGVESRARLEIIKHGVKGKEGMPKAFETQDQMSLMYPMVGGSVMAWRSP